LISIIYFYFYNNYTGINALYENDFKKVIGLSTLKQLGLIILRPNNFKISVRFVRILSFNNSCSIKSLLFLCAGIIIHLIKNNNAT